MKMWDQYIEWDKKFYMHHDMSMSDWEAATPLAISRVEGCYYIDHEGKKILDMLGGWICTNLGQRDPRIVNEIKKALDKYGWVPETYITPYKAEAAKLIVNDILGPDKWAGRVRFYSTGSESVSAAIIIAKLYTNRPNIITRTYAYHGWTEAMGGCSIVRKTRQNPLVSPENSEIRETPGSKTANVFIAPLPFCYRCPIGHEYPDCKRNGKLSCIQATEDLILMVGPENTAAIITELFSGIGSVGTVPHEYVPQLRKMCRNLGVLWIDDEVMCGFGRTGKWFAYQHWFPDVTPDIMVLGKGIASAQLPAAGVVVNKDIAEFFDKYRWKHYSTYAAHPVCMAAVVANIKTMIEKKIPDRAAKLGTYIEERLNELKDRHKCVGLVSGIGSFWSVELVKDKETKEPFVKEDRNASFAGDTSNYPTTIIKKKCLEKGVFCSGMVPNTLRIALPLIVTEEEIDKGMEALDYALTELDKMC